MALTGATIQANKRFFEKEEDVPRFAYTMGICDIMRANRVLMVVSGAGKAGIVKQAFFGPITPQVPASILQLHKDFTLVADEVALSALQVLMRFSMKSRKPVICSNADHRLSFLQKGAAE